MQVTRKISKFSLNNKEGEVELRYPTGKTASKMKYKKESGDVAEDELYTKKSGWWTWVEPKAENALALEDAPVEKTTFVTLEQKTFKEPGMILASSQTFSEDKNLRKIDFEKLANQSGKVLGAYAYKSSLSDKQTVPTYLETIFAKLNYAINYFLNYFFLKLGA